MCCSLSFVVVCWNLLFFVVRCCWVWFPVVCGCGLMFFFAVCRCGCVLLLLFLLVGCGVCVLFIVCGLVVVRGSSLVVNCWLSVVCCLTFVWYVRFTDFCNML